MTTHIRIERGPDVPGPSRCCLGYIWCVYHGHDRLGNSTVGYETEGDAIGAARELFRADLVIFNTRGKRLPKLKRKGAA